MTEPDAAAVNRTIAVLAPLAIVPPVMFQAYIVPSTGGTDAMLPAELGQTDEGTLGCGGGMLQLE